MISDGAAKYLWDARRAAELFRRRAGNAKPEDLHAILALTPDRAPDPGNELPDP